MNVTRENFEEVFPVMVDAIQASHFVAIDCEFTGLRLPDAVREGFMDSIQARYSGARSSASSFAIVQYGLCCFRFKDDDGTLEARPFNCFMFPSTKFHTDRVFSCQSSSMDFLSKHGFDFQAWAAHGVPFLSRAEEAIISQRLAERRAREEEAAIAALEKAAEEASKPKEEKPVVHVARDGTTLESMAETERDLVVDARKRVEALLEEVNSAAGEYVERSVKLKPMNGRQRWLIFEFVGSLYPGVKLSNLSGPGNARGMEIRTVPTDLKQRAVEEEKARETAAAKLQGELKMAVGLRRVIDELSKAGKPVVTHNGMLDLLHTYDKFVGPLPESHSEGTQALHSLFPVLFDNKVAMNAAVEAGLAFPRTVLGDGFKWLRGTQTKRDEKQAKEGNPDALPDNAINNGATTNGEATRAAQSPTASFAPASLTEKKEENDTSTVQSVPSAGGSTAADAENLTNGQGKVDGMEEEEEEKAAVSKGEGKVENETDEHEGDKRAVWDAEFPPGFEERYADGGQEHEAAYDAYLTGCCFVASAVLGLGVGAEELKNMGTVGGEVPEALLALQNVVPLYRMIADQKLCLPGPTPPPDHSKMVKVSGFPPAARTDAILRALTGAGVGPVRFHWIDDTSGVAECTSVEAVDALVAAHALATAAAASAAGEADADAADGETLAVDPVNLKLDELCVVAFAGKRRRNGVSGGEDGGLEGGAVEKDCSARGKKRPKQDDTAEEAQTGQIAATADGNISMVVS